MRSTRRSRALVVAAALAMFPAIGACDAVQGLLNGLFNGSAPAGDTQGPIPSDSVLLTIENHSGEPAVVAAYFENRNQDVRQTTRALAASGSEATEEILRTVAEKITVRAWITQPGYAGTAGEIMSRPAYAQRQFLLDSDFHGGDAILFIIPPAVDCNANGLPDADDISTGASRDCNTNGVPDECDIAQGVGHDHDGDGIMDECQHAGGLTIVCPGVVAVEVDGACHGPVPDFSSLITVGGGPVGDVTVTQDPPAGTPLAYGGSVDVSVQISDSAGAFASCATTVVLVDRTPPTLTIPPDAAVPCSQPTDPSSNPSVGFATATDNCDSLPPVTYSDDTSNLGDCQGYILRTWRAADGSGNAASAVQKITILPRPQVSRIYWTVWSVCDGMIQSALADGSDRRTYLANEFSPGEIAVDPIGGRMYWLGYSPGVGFGIRRAALDGAAVSSLPVDAAGSIAVAIDPVGQKLYWTRTLYASQTVAACHPWAAISRSDLSGAGETIIVERPPPSSGIAVAVDHDLNLICWTQLTGYCDQYQLYTAGLDGAAPHAIRTSSHQMTGVTIVPGADGRSVSSRLYWVEWSGYGGNSILRANLDGTGREAILTVPGDVILNISVDLAAGKLYWTQPISGRIGRANFDGTDADDFLTGLGPVTGIAVLPAPAP